MYPLQTRRALRLLGSVLIAGASLPLVTGATPQVAALQVATPDVTAVTSPAQTQKRATLRKSSELSPETANLLFAIAHRTADASHASALFAPKSWYTPPPPPPSTPQPQSAPSAPPLPFTYLGRYTDGNDVTVYFVSRDDRVYDVKPGDAIDAIYSVESIESGQLILLYKPLNTRQPLTIGDAP